jgi:hypothetical protein
MQLEVFSLFCLWEVANEQPSSKTADREINRAIIADEQANAHYYQILRRFIVSIFKAVGVAANPPFAVHRNSNTMCSCKVPIIC